MLWNSRPDRRRRRWPLVLLGVLLVLVAVVIASVIYTMQRASTITTATPTGTATASSSTTVDPVPDRPETELTWPDVTWYSVHGAQVPLSPTHGPRTNTGELASGFSHDFQGAVLAAINISIRTSGLAGGETVFEPTIATQTVGEVDQYLAATRENYAEIAARGGAPAPVVIGYRIEPASTVDDVRLRFVGRLTNPADPSLRALMTGSLRVRWSGGDWRLVVPTGAGEQINTIPPGFSAMPGQMLSITG